MKNWLIYTISLALILGCQTTPVKTHHKTEKAVTKESTSSTTAPTPVEDEETTDVENNPSFPPAAPAPVVESGGKWALVLGPGGALALGHVGVLRQLQKMKVEPDWIVGVEWASPIAALYSVEGTSQMIDWQFNKLKDENWPGSSSWFGDRQSLSMKDYSSWLNEAFQSRKTDQTRVKFLCPSFNTQKKITYIMNRGELKELVQYCWPFPPTVKSTRGAVAAPMALSAIVNHLRKQGAQKIIVVNVLGNSDAITVRDEERDLLWGQVQEEYSTFGARAQGADDVITLDLGSMKPSDFKRRREIIEAGEKKSFDSLEKIIKKYRL